MGATDVVMRAGPCSCGAYFADRQGLARHRATACPLVPKAERRARKDNAKKDTCDYCGAEMLARDVRKHVRLHHPNVA